MHQFRQFLIYNSRFSNFFTSSIQSDQHRFLRLYESSFWQFGRFGWLSAEVHSGKQLDRNSLA